MITRRKSELNSDKVHQRAPEASYEGGTTIRDNLRRSTIVGEDDVEILLSKVFGGVSCGCGDKLYYLGSSTSYDQYGVNITNFRKTGNMIHVDYIECAFRNVKRHE